MSHHDCPSRRRFLGQASALAGGFLASRAGLAATPSLLPTTTLGRTGLTVTRLALGCACAGQSQAVSVDEAAATYTAAMDAGITLLDAARGYGKGEEALGLALVGRRDQVVLTTKIRPLDRSGAERSFATSLRLLRTDRVEVCYLHGATDNDPQAVLDSAALAYLQELKAAGVVGAIGVSGHNRPQRMLRLVESDLFDVVLMAMNFVDRHQYGFEDQVLPAARQRGLGVLAMKVLGGALGREWSRYNGPNPGPQCGEQRIKLAVRYGLDLDGVHGLVIGMHTPEQVRANVAMFGDCPPLSTAERADLAQTGRSLVNDWGARFGPVA